VNSEDNAQIARTDALGIEEEAPIPNRLSKMEAAHRVLVRRDICGRKGWILLSAESCSEPSLRMVGKKTRMRLAFGYKDPFELSSSRLFCKRAQVLL